MATLALAHWATDLTPSSLPAPILQAALRSLYNYTGCAIAGSNHPTTLKAHTALAPFSPNSSPSHLLGQPSSTVSAPLAALLNGIASHVHDYDDTHLATIIHPTGPVASALLSYATHTSPSQPISGADLLTVLAAGIEAACKLGLAVWPTHYSTGWHITSTTGSIGAAVAVGKLMKLPARQLAHAIGLAATQVTGLREMFGSDCKSLHVGRAAESGFMAAVLAQEGFTSSTEALEAKRGWCRVVVGGGEEGERAVERLGELVGELGREWEVEKNAFKPFPCGIVCHAAIDGCVQLHEDGVEVGEIERVEARVHPLVMELTAKKEPKDGLEAKFSVFHGAAVGLLFGKAGPAEYADEVVRNAEVVEVREKIEAKADEGIAADEAHLKVHLAGGRVVVKHVQHAVGSLDRPMTDEQLEWKFVDQVGLVLGEAKAKKISDLAWGIADSPDVAAVISAI
ncbi:hypothetical protein WHR41_04694 [Cladosporium halotolerans]|uniref:Uncharacterized protein n=1 Tax=Cladosporium halotolerans TaxID=1052096 RepID=A0AB34KPA9_9PEZI